MSTKRIVVLDLKKIKFINTWHAIEVKYNFENSVIFVAKDIDANTFRAWCKENNVTQFTCFGKRGYELLETDFVLFKLFNGGIE